MNFFETFITSYGEAILYAVLTAIAGFLGSQIEKAVNTILEYIKK